MIIPENDSGCPELFFRGGDHRGDSICVNVGEIVTLDTYYNGFCFTKYRKYTTVNEVSFTVRLRGEAVLRLLCFDGERINVVSQCEGGSELCLTAMLSDLPEKGILYPEINAKTDAEILGGEYTAECSPDNINVCAAICTFKREQYVTRNLELMRAYKFSFLNRVFAVDNGRTLDAHALSDDFIKVLPNRNYGGSGGFTRGIIEAADGGFTHVILMDDDVELMPQTLEQMTVFVSLLTEEYRESWFSAAMIPLDDPRRQFELGAVWNGKEAEICKHNIDISNREALVDNLSNPNVQYGGWWTLLMPLSVTENGLPYPFFIKFDDVEYGMRKPNGTEIITMNGISVRHEAFDRKTSFILDYYNLRNELAINTIYGKCNGFGAAKRFLYEICKELMLYRYGNIPLVLDAARHFLKGPLFLRDTDEEQLNMSLINRAPKLVKLSDIPQWNEILRCDEHLKNKHISLAMALTLGGHLIPSFLLNKEIRAVPLSRTGAADCYGRKAVIQYQLGGDNGILTTRSFLSMLKYGILGCGMAIKIAVCFPRARKRWTTHKHEITGFDFWRKHLEI